MAYGSLPFLGTGCPVPDVGHGISFQITDRKSYHGPPLYQIDIVLYRSHSDESSYLYCVSAQD